jgi:oligopeptide/dipeptide ABC transporter ATP-binding protein
MRSIHVSAEVLSLEGLSVTFTTPAGEVQAVQDLSLQVTRGECVGVVGESGAGKSQAFLAVMGLLAANGRAAGKAVFGGTVAPGSAGIDLLSMRGAALDRIRGARMGMVFQDPMTSLTPHIAVGDQVAEPMVRHLGLSWREARARALSLLQQVHVSDASRRMTQFPHELSGGMRQRVMIAIALACDPQLLIADEPTTALDVTIQAQILSLLVELKRARGMAMVLITHDFGAVAGVADRVAVMQAGRVVELDSVRAVMKAPRHPYTRALLRALPRMESRDGSGDAPERSGDASDAATIAPNLSVSGLHVQFPVSRGWFSRPAVLRAVDDVSFDLRPGEALGVVGESGSGKSTLARAILRLLRPDVGQVVWLGTPVADLSSAALKPLRRNLQIVFQDPLASLDPRLTVGEIVSEPLRVHCPEISATDRAREVADMLVRVGLSSDLAGRYPHQFSGGQCQRIGIARAMILKPRLLVCDEPVSALDVSIQEQILTLLAGLKCEYGMSILFVSHNLAVVRRICDRVLVLYLGRMMELAPVEALYTQPRHPYTRELLEAVPIPDPDIQQARLGGALSGEPPSPLSPPSGCVYRTRCALAAEVCRTVTPAWEPVDPTSESAHGVACHRWREVARSTF